MDDHGSLFYSENFAGKLWMRKKGKTAKVIYTSAAGPEGPAEVGAVSTRDDIVYFAAGTQVLRRKDGKVKPFADIGKFEEAHNPDGGVTYGAVGLSEECKAQWPTGEGAPPVSYTGIVESHPYATAYGDGALYVADAAANAVFRVRKGKIKTVAVLPATGVTITAQMAEGFGLPDCAVGKTYNFEGVPTDVEFADGKLFISSLAGGPEDGTVPGAVYRTNLKSGTTKRYASGFVGASGLAVADDGNVYVSELFAGKVTRITPKRKVRTFVETASPAAVEVRGKRLFVTENVFAGLGPDQAPGGKIVRYTR